VLNEAVDHRAASMSSPKISPSPLTALLKVTITPAGS
jgi:hypothetical protein